MCVICYDLQRATESICQCCGSRIEHSSVVITPFMKYMKIRMDVSNGVNVEDDVIKNYRFTNVKRNRDPGSFYVFADLCSLKIKVCITH